MPSLYLGYIDYGSLPVTLSPGTARSDFLLQLPMRGQLAASIGGESIGGESIEASAVRAAIASPACERCWFMSSADSARLQVSLNEAALGAQLAALLGDPRWT